MRYWLIPCDSKKFRIHDYFASNKIVDWKQSHYIFEQGDIVFIYCSAPDAEIKYMLEVEQPNILYKDSINDEEYWGDKHMSKVAAEQNKYVRLKLICSIKSSKLDIESLYMAGLKTTRGPQTISGDLLSYILSACNE